jgi:chorismate mutase / prephenate dehydratase
MNLTDLRKKIDTIDDDICKLFQKRMEVVDAVGEYKRAHNEPVNNGMREREILTRISKSLPPHLEDFGRSLYRSIFDISKAYEAMYKEKDSPLYKELSALISAKPEQFPTRATVACQGREGAYSQLAAERLFEIPEIMYNKTFEGVFKMVSDGMCEYGILPIENSTAGSVNEIYDQLVKYDVHIVRSTRVKIDHLLLGAKGMKLNNMKVIYSHPQAIQQCSNYLGNLKDVQIIPCENTAIAAVQVSKDETRTSASISSRSCAELYNMEILDQDIQNYDSNYTRFICISKKARIYPGADRTSIMMVIPNKPGTLFSVLSRFSAIGANMVKLESRPIPNRDFEFVFYFDIELSIYNDKFASLISELDHCEEQFKYFGTYSEII